MKKYLSREEDVCHVFDYLSKEIRSNLIKPFTDQNHNQKTEELVSKISSLKAEFFQLIQSHNAQGIDNK